MDASPMIEGLVLYGQCVFFFISVLNTTQTFGLRMELDFSLFLQLFGVLLTFYEHVCLNKPI